VRLILEQPTLTLPGQEAVGGAGGAQRPGPTQAVELELVLELGQVEQVEQVEKDEQ